jgi:hypothetical protein
MFTGGVLPCHDAPPLLCDAHVQREREAGVAGTGEGLK